ncbi:DUF86 domain-containing protein [Patescibacteria group bacterium]|nr:DUF86 domain-containing protein [Patescibacteria group bacterium]
MKKDPEIFLEHILESIEEIERNMNKLTEKDFYTLTTIQDAVIRRLEIIGEAVKNLPTLFICNFKKFFFCHFEPPSF